MSFTATNSRPVAPICAAARTTFLPMRPKPLIPTRIAIWSPLRPTATSLSPHRSPERNRLHPLGPARPSASAAASRVAPVVNTSSTSTARTPRASAAAKAPDTLARRSSGVKAVWVAVSRVRWSRSVRTASPRLLPSATASRSLWLYPRSRSRRRASGIGIKDTPAVNGSRPFMRAAIGCVTRHQPSYLSRCTTSRAPSSSRTALRTRASPAGQSAQTAAGLVEVPRFSAASAHGSAPAPAAPAETAHQCIALAGGTPRRHKTHSPGRSHCSTPRTMAPGDSRGSPARAPVLIESVPAGQRAGSTERGIDRCPHDLPRGRHARKPALERCGALSHQHRAAVGRANARARSVRTQGVPPLT